MIFFEGSESVVVASLQRLAARKISKNHKNSKANSVFISQNIDLPAKTTQKRVMQNRFVACAEEWGVIIMASRNQ